MVDREEEVLQTIKVCPELSAFGLLDTITKRIEEGLLDSVTRGNGTHVDIETLLSSFVHLFQVLGLCNNLVSPGEDVPTESEGALPFVDSLCNASIDKFYSLLSTKLSLASLGTTLFLTSLIK